MPTRKPAWLVVAEAKLEVRMHDELAVAYSKGRIDGALLLLILKQFPTAKLDVGDALRSRA